VLADYERYRLSGEINSVVDDPAATVAAVETAYASTQGATVDHLDGLTVTTDDWWFNVRPSNTEPLLRLNVEGADDATMTRVRDHVLALIRSSE
jgi:phosphomannomutase